MKISKVPLRTTIAQATRSPRTRWFFLASLVTLLVASRHTLPVHDATPGYNPVVAVLQTSAEFYLAGMCIAFARMSVNNSVHIAAIAALNGLYAIAVSQLAIKTMPASQLDVAIGAVIVAGATALGAFAAVKYGLPFGRKT